MNVEENFFLRRVKIYIFGDILVILCLLFGIIEKNVIFFLVVSFLKYIKMIINSFLNFLGFLNWFLSYLVFIFLFFDIKVYSKGL